MTGPELEDALSRLDAVLGGIERRLDDEERLQAVARFMRVVPRLRSTMDELVRSATTLVGARWGGVTAVGKTAKFVAAHNVAPEQLIYPRDESFCQLVAASGEPLDVEDSRRHPLVRGLALALRPDDPVVAYYGTPIVSPDGWPVASFCVFDDRVRVWRPDDAALLDEHAHRVTQHLKELTT